MYETQNKCSASFQGITSDIIFVSYIQFNLNDQTPKAQTKTVRRIRDEGFAYKWERKRG